MSNPSQEAWTQLIEPVRRYMLSRVRDEHTAADLAQDVMLKAHATLDAAPEGVRLVAWMFGIARNTLIDFYRAQAHRAHDSVERVEELVAAADGAGTDAIAELSGCLTRMVEQLPEPYRAAIKLADFEGLSQADVADRAGISLSGAKSRVQRARQMLREMIQDCCRIERDVRGNAFDLETTERSARYCGTEDEGRPRCGP